MRFVSQISVAFFVSTLLTTYAGGENGGDGGSPEKKIPLPRVPTIPRSSTIKDHPHYVNIYGPPPPTSPKCDFATLKNNPHDAHEACMIECRDISFVALAAWDMYPNVPGVKRLHSECGTFLDGHCYKLWARSGTWCLCQGKDHNYPVRFCRGLIGATRMATNSVLVIRETIRDYKKWREDYAKEKEQERVDFEEFVLKRKNELNEEQARRQFKKERKLTMAKKREAASQQQTGV